MYLGQSCSTHSRSFSCTHSTDSLNFGILPENRIFDMFLGNEDTLPNAKSSSVLPWLVPVINQNAKQQLALSWHSIHIQQLIHEVGQMMSNTTHCLAKCICYYQQWKSIHLLYKLVKTSLQVLPEQMVLYNISLALQIYTTYIPWKTMRDN